MSASGTYLLFWFESISRFYKMAIWWRETLFSDSVWLRFKLDLKYLLLTMVFSFSRYRLPRKHILPTFKWNHHDSLYNCFVQESSRCTLAFSSIQYKILCFFPSKSAIWFPEARLKQSIFMELNTRHCLLSYYEAAWILTVFKAIIYAQLFS